MTMFLQEFPFIANITGIGFYPIFCKNGKLVSNGLIYHLNIRGKTARWARVDGRYVSILAGIEVLEDLLENGCGGIPIEDLALTEGTI